MTQHTEQCLHCNRSSKETPLVHLRYDGNDYWICPLGMPMLIHNPERLSALAGEWKKTGVSHHEH